jgi:pimeloyl-ACP methyl ester carboxylesterase
MGKATASPELTYDGTSRFLDTPKGRMHYHEAGAGDRAPVLLLHGSGPGVTGWLNFGANLPHFAERFRTLVLDLPGFGASDLTDGHPSASGPESVIRFIDGLGLETVSIVGNSMGGGIGARVAAAYPDRVAKLATLGGVGMNLFTAFPAEGINLLMDFVEDPSRERLVVWMKSMVYDHSILSDEMIDERFAETSNPDAIESARRMYSRANFLAMRASRKGAGLDYLTEIKAPTLITWGRDDRVSPLDMALVAMRLIAKCELHVFPDCGHWAMIERKREFESVVTAFLSR